MPYREQIDKSRIPAHVAIIMDGNRRWAKARGKQAAFGHKEGAKTLEKIVRYANSIGLEYITVYAFSTENWKRPVTEVNFIMELLSRYLTSEIEEFHKNNVKVRFMGSREGLPETVKKKMEYAEKVTADNTGIVLNLAINYGGQAEILHAVQNIVSDVQSGLLRVEDIDSQKFEDYLYTRGLPAPDLLIRPGGDLRISNFMLWQIAYAEIWTTEVYWPAFTPEMFLEAVKAYGGRERRYGGLITK